MESAIADIQLFGTENKPHLRKYLARNLPYKVLEIFCLCFKNSGVI